MILGFGKIFYACLFIYFDVLTNIFVTQPLVIKLGEQLVPAKTDSELG